MKILINPKTFLAEFINPILDVNKNGKTAVFVEDGLMYTTYTPDDGTFAFYQTFKPKSISEEIPRFNIDMNKFSQALNCLDKNCEEIVLVLDSVKKTLSFKHDIWNITLRLIIDALTPVARFNPRKIAEYTGIVDEFIIPTKTILDLKKSDTLTSDSLKFYLEKENDQLFCTMGDKTESHLHQATVLLREKFDKEFTETAYNVAFLRNIFRIKHELTMRLLDNGALIFLTNLEDAKTIFATTKIKK